MYVYGVKSLFVVGFHIFITMGKNKLKKEYSYDLLIGFLMIWTILVGFYFIKTSTQIAFITYDYVIANINNI
ncbi:hypothetical protein A3I18_00280 [Candidatus Campbellbacteria bacterium RIFCSPLOWO2_02_FULL_35_11]|uniref:Uncharacterized protein n=1 Tax=Candidatus Campbellbacteria bacterium RIFCSPLOWO2_02_FULL_35_11 TaxID=1797581 RepID=A0A1F5EU23_9BACT|nr:MAG: hypothetical protein A3I18_00280 [Candidatus Campbellbacteria bacterium RIFCSPLOWO2_02_FULL_35_11]